MPTRSACAPFIVRQPLRVTAMLSHALDSLENADVSSFRPIHSYKHSTYCRIDKKYTTTSRNDAFTSRRRRHQHLPALRAHEISFYHVLSYLIRPHDLFEAHCKSNDFIGTKGCIASRQQLGTTPRTPRTPSTFPTRALIRTWWHAFNWLVVTVFMRGPLDQSKYSTTSSGETGKPNKP